MSKYWYIGNQVKYEVYVSQTMTSLFDRRSNSADLELLYWNPVTGDQVTDMELVEKVEWASQNCVLTFTTLGVWGDSENDRTDINSTSKSGELLAAGDDSGSVRMFRFPAIQLSSESKELLGHSAHVTAVEFLDDPHKLVSAGGRETSLMQWSL